MSKKRRLESLIFTFLLFINHFLRLPKKGTCNPFNFFNYLFQAALKMYFIYLASHLKSIIVSGASALGSET